MDEREMTKINGRIGLIGFGEAAQAFVTGWRKEGRIDISTYDILFDRRDAAAAKRAQCAALDVRPVASAAELAADVDYIFSVVTAEQAVVAARSVLSGARAGLVYFDMNSAAPFRKQEAASILATKGVDYVDVAIMTPVHPLLNKSPILVGGKVARAVEPLLASLGMSFEIVSDSVGTASTIKMMRSVAIKGIESVIAECVVGSMKLGVADRVLPSVAAAFTNIDFRKRMDYMLERVAVHGKRRAEEMREVAATLEHAGVTNFTAAASAAQQQTVADMTLAAEFGGKVPQDAERLGALIIERLKNAAPAPKAKLAKGR
jgi:3-hydroxyisobutyrate dehydrogenase-like beta-hydroxyacid dehydrogenase